MPPSPPPQKKKAPPAFGGALEKLCVAIEGSVAQVDRPAEAGVMMPVVVRQAEH